MCWVRQTAACQSCHRVACVQGNIFSAPTQRAWPKAGFVVTRVAHQPHLASKGSAKMYQRTGRVKHSLQFYLSIKVDTLRVWHAYAPPFAPVEITPVSTGSGRGKPTPYCGAARCRPLWFMQDRHPGLPLSSPCSPTDPATVMVVKQLLPVTLSARAGADCKSAPALYPFARLTAFEEKSGEKSANGGLGYAGTESLYLLCCARLKVTHTAQSDWPPAVA